MQKSKKKRLTRRKRRRKSRKTIAIEFEVFWWRAGQDRCVAAKAEVLSERINQLE